MSDDSLRSPPRAASQGKLPVSLLWPQGAGHHDSTPRLNVNAIHDLGLEKTIDHLCLDSRYRRDVVSILLALITSTQTIRYRQDILDDLLRCPDLVENMEGIGPRLSELGKYQSFNQEEDLLYEVTWRLGELEVYVDCIRQLNQALGEHETSLKSTGFKELRRLLSCIEEDEVFKNLAAQLPDLLAQVRGIGSVTIGVNLDRHLRPFEATLVSVNRRKYRGSKGNLFHRLLGVQPDNAREQERERGIAPLHAVPRQSRTPGSTAEESPVNPMLIPLFRDLSRVLNRVSEPIAVALKRYMGVNSRFLIELGSELAFYLGGIRLIHRIEASGLPMCRPEIREPGERICSLRDTYNINLALRMSNEDNSIVTNDVDFGDGKWVFILTGPNRGGKTTYMQAIGLTQVLAQAGLHVPGREARLSPVDGIFTHFPAEEKPDLDTGRLGEEARRLADIFATATECSLIMLNESLANTSPNESLFLARDIVRVLRLLGVRSIFTTHLHELAGEAPELNSENGSSVQIVSLVSQVSTDPLSGDTMNEHAERTFKIIPSQPTGFSYAGEIASRYGIDYEGLVRILKERGLI